MKTLLNTQIIHPYVYGWIAEDMMRSSISTNKFSVHIERFEIQRIGAKKFVKPTLDISYYVKHNKKDLTTKVKSKTVVVFKGKGDIPYKVNLDVSIVCLITNDQIDTIKSYTYALSKAYLENDANLLELYPRDLVYPSSVLDSSINVIEQEEERHIPTIRICNETITKKALTNEKVETGAFTEEEERRFKELIEEYNKSQNRESKKEYSTNF